MSKVTFASLKLKMPNDVKIVEYNNAEIEVLQYLPAEEKNNLIELIIQEADHGTVLNPLLQEELMYLYIVMKYANIQFTEKQKENMLALYDLMDTNGLIDAVIGAIPESEFKAIYDNVQEITKQYNQYRNSARALIEQFQAFAPKEAAAMNEQLKDFDVNKMEHVLKLAEATGAYNKANLV